MASIYTRGKTQWGRVEKNGRLLRKSLGTDSKTIARKRLREWLHELDSGKFDQRNDYTFDELAESFFGNYLPTLKSSAQRRYKTSLRQLAPFFKGAVLSDINNSELYHFVSRRRRTAKDPTINRDLALFSSMITHGQVDLDWPITNPILPFKKKQQRRGKLKESAPKTRYLTIDEEQQLLRATNSDIRDQIAFNIETGLRASELWGLTWESISNETPNYVNLHKELLVITGKGGKLREVPLSPRAIEILEFIPRHISSPYVFYNPYNYKNKPAGSPYENRRYGLQNLVDRSGIERITWHDLRRTYGCRMLQDHGLSMEEVRQLLGHSSVVVTEQAYAFLNVGKIQKKLRENGHKNGHRAVENTL